MHNTSLLAIQIKIRDGGQWKSAEEKHKLSVTNTMKIAMVS